MKKIGNGYSKNDPENEAYLSLHSAIRDAKVDEVTLIISCGENVINQLDKYGWTPLTLAAKKGFCEIAAMLIKEKADINAPDGNGATPITVAIKECRKGIVLLLLESGVDINQQDADGYLPIHHAIIQGNEDIIASLVKSGVDLNASDNAHACVSYSV